MNERREVDNKKLYAEDNGPHYWQDTGMDWKGWIPIIILIVALVCMAVSVPLIMF